MIVIISLNILDKSQNCRLCHKPTVMRNFSKMHHIDKKGAVFLIFKDILCFFN